MRAVEMMDKICRRAEEDETYEQIMEAVHPATIGDPSDAIATAAHFVSEDVQAVAIVTYTMSGKTALRMARQLAPHSMQIQQLPWSWLQQACFEPVLGSPPVHLAFLVDGRQKTLTM